MPVYRQYELDFVGNSVLLPHEQAVMRNNLYMRFINPPIERGRQVQQGTGYDAVIMFQFPPKITSDSKSINWFEKDVKSYEPEAFFMGSKARSIAMKWEYMVYGDWTPLKIFDQVRRVKKHAYFGNISDAKAQGPDAVKAPIVELVAYLTVPKASQAGYVFGLDDVGNAVTQFSTWRCKTIDIKYSDEMAVYSPEVAQSSAVEAGNVVRPTNAWPVHTEVSINLDLLTLNAVTDVVVSDEGENAGTLNNYGDIPPNPQDIWY